MNQVGLFGYVNEDLLLVPLENMARQFQQFANERGLDLRAIFHESGGERAALWTMVQDLRPHAIEHVVVPSSAHRSPRTDRERHALWEQLRNTWPPVTVWDLDRSPVDDVLGEISVNLNTVTLRDTLDLLESIQPQIHQILTAAALPGMTQVVATVVGTLIADLAGAELNPPRGRHPIYIEVAAKLPRPLEMRFRFLGRGQSVVVEAYEAGDRIADPVNRALFDFGRAGRRAHGFSSGTVTWCELLVPQQPNTFGSWGTE